MANHLDVVIGGSFEADLADVAAAWKAAEAGERVETVDRVSFVEWSSFASVFTPKRLALLRYLRATSGPVRSIRACARALDRDVRRVHDDLTALTALGLVERHQDGSLRAPYDEIVTTVRLRNDPSPTAVASEPTTPA